MKFSVLTALLSTTNAQCGGWLQAPCDCTTYKTDDNCDTGKKCGTAYYVADGAEVNGGNICTDQCEAYSMDDYTPNLDVNTVGYPEDFQIKLCYSDLTHSGITDPKEYIDTNILPAYNLEAKQLNSEFLEKQEQEEAKETSLVNEQECENDSDCTMLENTKCTQLQVDGTPIENKPNLCRLVSLCDETIMLQDVEAVVVCDFQDEAASDNEEDKSLLEDSESESSEVVVDSDPDNGLECKTNADCTNPASSKCAITYIQDVLNEGPQRCISVQECGTSLLANDQIIDFMCDNNKPTGALQNMVALTSVLMLLYITV